MTSPSVQDAITKFENTEEKARTASDTLSSLLDLAQQQHEVFYLKVTYVQGISNGVVGFF